MSRLMKPGGLWLMGRMRMAGISGGMSRSRLNPQELVYFLPREFLKLEVCAEVADDSCERRIVANFVSRELREGVGFPIFPQDPFHAAVENLEAIWLMPGAVLRPE